MACLSIDIRQLSPHSRRADNFNNYLTDDNDIIFILLHMGTCHNMSDNTLILQL